MTKDASAAPEPMRPDRFISVALSLMRMALALLDRSDDATFGAARLQHAIDTLEGVPVAMSATSALSHPSA